MEVNLYNFVQVLATSSGRDSRTSGHLENDPLNGPDGDTRLNFGDSENMVSSSNSSSLQDYAFDSTSISTKRENHLRYRTRVFAAECLSHLPAAVGKDPAHFDISLARKMSAKGDWLALHVQELIALAYQISTIQFENMRPIGVGLLSTIMDKVPIIGICLLDDVVSLLLNTCRLGLSFSNISLS
ncbi:HEAT repeat-containing protein [Actinidia rufa]|uniref:HEAT repeat-containing protein n=1 Tax=Actinidia rufa TaxID=165716 RepID=A0A7J0H7F7_9ERIC|nr:HEAT repeat-containing protein [Actinidia rufa]